MLDRDEYRHFESILATYLLSHEAAFNLHRENILAAAEWEGQLSALAWIIETPGFQRYWSTRSSRYPSDFSAFIGSKIRDSDAAAQQPAPVGADARIRPG